MLQKMKNLVVEEGGQGLLEYGLILAGVVAVVAIAVLALTEGITKLFGDVKAKLNDAVK